MEIHVGNNKDGRTNNLCDRFYQRRDYREAMVECFQPVSGKYVTIRTPFDDPIKLCEVQVLGTSRFCPCFPWLTLGGGWPLTQLSHHQAKMSFTYFLPSAPKWSANGHVCRSADKKTKKKKKQTIVTFLGISYHRTWRQVQITVVFIHLSQTCLKYRTMASITIKSFLFCSPLLFSSFSSFLISLWMPEEMKNLRTMTNQQNDWCFFNALVLSCRMRGRLLRYWLQEGVSLSVWHDLQQIHGWMSGWVRRWLAGTRLSGS